MEHLSLSCKHCTQILDTFLLSEEEQHRLELGPVSEVLPVSNACPDHTPLLLPALIKFDQKLQDEGNEDPPFGQRTDDTRMLIIYKFPQRTTIDFLIVNNGVEFALKLDQQIVYREDELDHHGLGILVDENFIDITLLERWKLQCERDHEQCRFQRSLTKGDPVRPLLLIDVRERCIVDSSKSEGDFVALSYCWGVPEPGEPYWFRNEKGISEALRKPGALSIGTEYGDKLPATIRDAIELTRVLGERYLWVDSLCVMQDDNVMKSIELPKMAEIYASACLTIIAGQGSNAGYGLHGFPFTRPRSWNQEVVTISGERLMRSTLLDIALNTTRSNVYSSRGWTFQEYRFGRRRLIFEDDSVRWECRDGGHCEDARHKPAREKPVIVEDLPNPGLYELNDIINDYCKRKLGRNEDAFPAFCGYQRVLGRVYPEGFINGMSVGFFDEMMAWVPLELDVYRRKAEKEENSPPSWSWMGWAGKMNVKYNGKRLLDPEVMELHSLHVGNLVDWYTMTGLDSPKLPLRDSPQLKNEDFSLSREPSMLFCKTQSAIFQLGATSWEDEEDIEWIGPWYEIRDESGKWSGVVRLHQREDAKDVGRSIELVAVSVGHGPEKEPAHEVHGLVEWRCKERPRNGTEYHFYNVLWIERKGDVAYRRAAGRIAKDVWESCDSRPVDLILG
ncbi:HET-domain-containing protein [Microthyrium microscopicum]|uniref:HET-domain-containing protein n=1 Tax=Microthyrium microscopicum TaxID=703497 RepID=A0A6A6URZ6_9PEZI|nr:HET-domain-containing protein [Microthyrium microscopicum]